MVEEATLGVVHGGDTFGDVLAAPVTGDDELGVELDAAGADFGFLGDGT